MGSGISSFFFWLMLNCSLFHAEALEMKSLSLLATMATPIYISLGGNLGRRERFLLGAIASLKMRLGEFVQMSALYETPPWGFDSDLPFLNAVAQFNTTLAPEEVLGILLKTEREFGRKRKQSETYTSRTLDLDLLFYGDEMIDSPLLQLPHPRIHQRAFVLVPLAEIAPELHHPEKNKSILELLTLCTDTSEIKPWTSPTAT